MIGVSGDEDEIRMYIKEKISSYADQITEDSIGNLIVYKKYKNKKNKKSDFKIMLSAHMDEVGFMVTGYGDSGTIRFRPVGGIDERILLGKRVLIGDKKLQGVIGVKPIHLQDSEGKERVIKIKNMYIDIGAQNKEEAEKNVLLGEYIGFNPNFEEIGDDCIKTKALDDRIGCAILIDVLKQEFDFDLYVCFTVQEEVGLRGAEVAANRIMPDLAIVIEGTTCSDVPKVEEYEQSTKLNLGPALTIMDRTSYCDKELVDFIYKVANDSNIKVQFKKTTLGGNDAGRIQLSGKGCRVASISVPCRYIHSPVSIMSKNDFNDCGRLLSSVLRKLSTEGNKCLILSTN